MGSFLHKSHNELILWKAPKIECDWNVSVSTDIFFMLTSIFCWNKVNSALFPYFIDHVTQFYLGLIKCMPKWWHGHHAVLWLKCTQNETATGMLPASPPCKASMSLLHVIIEVDVDLNISYLFLQCWSIVIVGYIQPNALIVCVKRVYIDTL